MIDSTASNIKVLRKYLKIKVLEDNITFTGHNAQRKHVYELMKKTIINGEAHSALILGPRGCGKTTLINSVLNQLDKEADLENDAIIIRLSGLLHHDDKVALKAITAQMQLENAVGDKVFGTFAENLSFLLSCLKSGSDRSCKSMVFVLDEFDMFCHGVKTQTLLYNLFDITHTGNSPMCVIGITSRLDVMELLEKRVKSRFSHRHIYLYPNNIENEENITQDIILKNFLEKFVNLLSLPVIKTKKSRKKSVTEKGNEQNSDVPIDVLIKCNFSSLDLDKQFVEDWNSHVDAVSKDELVINAIEKFCYYTVNEQIFRDVLFQVISKISTATPYIDVKVITKTIDETVGSQHRVTLLQSLSILELSLVIAMKHGIDIFDGQPMNFEMVLHRYTKFANINSSAQTVPRPVILKAFEHLQSLEIIKPVKHSDTTETTVSRVQKEYELYTLSTPIQEIDEAVKGFNNLPTEISHWYSNFIV